MIATLKIPAPSVVLREALHHPHAPTVGAFAVATFALALAAWFILRNVRHNEPGLKAPAALLLALILAASGVFAAQRLSDPWRWPVGGAVCVIAASLFLFADRNRFVRDPHGEIVADRWEIVLKFARFQWTRDKANRHFFFTGDTGSGKTTGMNGLLTALMKRNPHLGGIVMANKGDEWFFIEWLAKKCGREHDLIRLHPRALDDPPGEPQHRLNVTGDVRLPFTTRARILVDTAAALNPKDERSFFKIKGAAHIGRALELLTDLKRPATATNAYMLLTSEKELKAALDKLTELEPTPRRIQLAEVLEQTYLKHEAKEQRAGEIGTSQNYLEYLGTPEVAEVFSSNAPDTCCVADVDKGKILCVDVPQDFTTERQYIFTVMKLLLYRHALRRYALPGWRKYALNQLIYVGDEFQTAITASFDGTSDFNVVDRLRDCLLMLIVSAQAFESLVPPQTKEQAEVLALNLKNLFMYRAASEADAFRCANALGKRWVERASRTVHLDHTAYTYSRAEEFRIKPHEFRNLSDHTAIVRHCTNGYKKVRLRPRGATI
ncbi:type IV secretory system conjugative DNA transfer family protein [Opitutus terrae]|uniref:TraD/TraG TraM recognition site domain-containing protein n=1 Tax=Opitutus terrae (strain DSM 11246 / JCM 15787 / PB90-1) TaxID=452637 RepID=B1ZPG1_OPITP|nr:hypothetical protein [Opitutus terrae]ACB74480.1 hypothetical protein Oter_1194 [Opitutus terrae PB90-1]